MSVMIEDAARRLLEFQGRSLTDSLADYEWRFQGADRATAEKLCTEAAINGDLLAAATAIKQLAAQISVIIHAAGILAAIPRILDSDETVEYLSLGAGNTGRPFDLETNKRVAEFKFITWQGGAESIRQNSLFKDFYYLAEADTQKYRQLYVLGTDRPLKFLRGGRKLDSVMSRNASLAADFQQRYGDRFAVVREYYKYRQDEVELHDLIPLVPELANSAA